MKKAPLYVALRPGWRRQQEKKALKARIKDFTVRVVRAGILLILALVVIILLGMVAIALDPTPYLQ